MSGSGPMAPYQGHLLLPGMGSSIFSAEADNMGLIAGSPLSCRWVTYAVISGASRDAGNSPTTTLRPNLVMAKLSATNKWVPFVTGGSDGSEEPLGILYNIGLATQMGGADADRFMASILVGGYVNPEAICISASSTYGLDKATAAHLVVRKAFKYAFQFSDDFMSYTPEALADR